MRAEEERRMPRGIVTRDVGLELAERFLAGVREVVPIVDWIHLR
jgi:hypothetical protein